MPDTCVPGGDWESDPDCERWWRKGQPEEKFSLRQARDIEEEPLLPGGDDMSTLGGKT